MSGTKLNITVEELADFIMAGRNDSFDISEEQARQAARRMLAADALYKAAFLIAGEVSNGGTLLFLCGLRRATSDRA